MGVDKASPSASLKGDRVDEVEDRLEKQPVDREIVQHRLLVIPVKDVHDVVVEGHGASLLCLLGTFIVLLVRGECCPFDRVLVKDRPESLRWGVGRRRIGHNVFFFV